MVPVRAFKANAIGDEMYVVSKWHGEKTTEITVHGSRQILNSITYTNKDV